jgi:NAD-dependent SIR2 family protein deacetylase
MSGENGELQQTIEAAAATIEEADALIILAGAGMSVDSGLPDYRGDEGLWNEHPFIKEHGMSFIDMANPKLFEDDPALAWQFYAERQQMCRDTTPHRGYELLRKWGQAKKQGYFAVTSNVDGHFNFAGYPGDRVVECHGNLHYNQCCEPCHDQIWLDIPDEWERKKMSDEQPMFFCPECNGVARPNVMMFGDWDWIREPTEKQTEKFDSWVRTLQAEGTRVAIVEVGAGTTLPAVRMQSESLLNKFNARLIRINLREAEGNADTLSIELSALEALERIEQELSGRFANDCDQKDAELSEPPSQETIKRRIANFIKGNPGGVISTNPSNHLKNIKSRKVYGKPFLVTRENETMVWVERFEMRMTHAGMIAGLPSKEHVQRNVEAAEQYVRDKWHGPKTRLIQPKIYDARSKQPILPSLTMMAQLRSYERRNDDEDGTWLNLVWFADIDDKKTIADFVADALQQVDWKTDSESYMI